jgi:hypothetical protein
VTSQGNGNCWYNIEYRTYPASTSVRSFSLEQVRTSAALVEQIQQTLLRPGTTLPANLTQVPPRRERLAPGGALDARLAGPAAIRMLSVRLLADDLPKALRATVIRIECDGQQTVWCPLSDFFGSGIGLNPYRDWYREVDRDGLMTCYWIMPFQRQCLVRLENLGDQPVDAVLGSIATSPWQWDDRSMHFHAGWRQESPIETLRADGTKDWNYVEIQGQGVYIGDSLALFNGAGPWWGEGDEKVYVDGETFPSHFGTGSEDYYGYSYGDQGVFFQAPFHAEPRWDGNNKRGYVSVTRTRSLDAIPFGRSLKFDLEIWHWSATTVGYAATTYWYARPGATSNRPPMPEEAAGLLPGTIKPQPGRYEGESIRIAGKTGGITEIQENSRWSNSQQLWWRDGKPGDRLELVLPVAESGRYKIGIHVTRAFDYGILQFSLDGQKLGDPADLYSAENRTEFRPLGEKSLEKGDHRLTIEIVGSNPQAKPRHMLGLDYVQLNKTP